jgi:hypothetical protein
MMEGYEGKCYGNSENRHVSLIASVTIGSNETTAENMCRINQNTLSILNTYLRSQDAAGHLGQRDENVRTSRLYLSELFC